MTFLKFLTVVMAFYLAYYIIVYFLEISKKKGSATANQNGNVVYSVAPEKTELVTVVGKQLDKQPIANQPSDEDGEKKN
jgi:uncharacterized protein (UPF0333 family)